MKNDKAGDIVGQQFISPGVGKVCYKVLETAGDTTLVLCTKGRNKGKRTHARTDLILSILNRKGV
jgi:hypothetical protein